MNKHDIAKSPTELAKRDAKRFKIPPKRKNLVHQQAIRIWLKEEFRWQHPYSVTLTLKKGTELNGRLVMGNRYDYAQNLKHFLNILNKAIFGGMAHAGWQMSVASFFERSSDGLPHFHLEISRPAHLPEDYFRWLINHLWARTTWGRRINHVNRVSDDGWIDYITKLETKEKFDDALELSGTFRCDRTRDVPFKISRKRSVCYVAERARELAVLERGMY